MKDSQVSTHSGISRRDLFKMGGVAAIGAVGASGLVACAPQAKSTKESGGAAADAAALPKGYMCSTDWLGTAPEVGAPTETFDCDIVVAGGGHAGIQAALAAAEGGAKVIVIETVAEENRKVKGEDIGHVNSQWLINQGFGPYDIGEVVSEFVLRTNARTNAEIIRKYVANSGEMFDHTAALVKWPDSRIKLSKTADPAISPLDPSQVIVQVPGIAADGPVAYPMVRGGYKSWAGVAQFMGPIQHAAAEGVAAFSRLDEFQQFALLEGQDLGAQWHYQTSAVKLLQDDAGKVNGLIAKKEDGTIVQYNTATGVILCTGDYAANGDMVWNLNTEVSEWAARAGQGPEDVTGFSTSDGTGHKMACWAGGMMEPAPRAVMSMGGGGGGPWGTSPYLWVNASGMRYMNESATLAAWPQSMRQPAGPIASITDANWFTIMKNASLDHGAPNYGRPDYFTELVDDMAKVPVGGKEGGKCKTCTIAERMESVVFAANTLEELCDLIGYTGTAKTNLLASVKRFNELCKAGKDADYGKDAVFMQAIETPPFYASLSKNDRSANAGLVTLAGVMTDDDLQVLNSDNVAIGGLWAAGNCLGGRYGGGYATPFAGNSIGMAMTHGRVAGKLATKQEIL
ncbi:MAG: FAD-binding protein [Raoultibacter sp.]